MVERTAISIGLAIGILAQPYDFRYALSTIYINTQGLIICLSQFLIIRLSL